MTDKQKQFVNYYLGRAHLNATKAAALAGYANPNQQAWRIRQDPEVAQAIRDRLEAETLKADEVLHILSEQARGNIRDFIEPLHGGRWLFDIVDDDKPMHRVKSLSQTEKGVKIEMYDAQAAAVHIGRHYKLFTDKTEIDLTETPYDSIPDEELDAELAALKRGETKEASSD